MWLWRPSPTFYCLQTEDPGKMTVCSLVQIWRLENQRELMVWISVWRQEKTNVPAHILGQKGQNLPSSAFCSTQALSVLNKVHPRWGGPTTLLGPLIQMLISSINILTTRNTVLIQAPHGRWSWHIKLIITCIKEFSTWKNQFYIFITQIL